MNCRLPEVGSSRKRGLTLIELVVVLVILVILTTLQVPVLRKARARACETVCGNNLKQIALAAMQYSDDKRFFPHIAKISVLDGDYTSTTSAQCLRSLVYFNYLDNPAAFVCPSSVDSAAPLTESQKQDIRKWSWKKCTEVSDTTRPPIVHADSNDRALNDPGMASLSYGWTRRGLTSNTLGSETLAADKARRQGDTVGSSGRRAHTGQMIGNHEDRMNFVGADAHTSCVKPESDCGCMTTGSTFPSISGACTLYGGDGFFGVLADE